MAEELYNAGKYSKANRLFAQIVPDYRGKPQAEKLMFLYSSSFYKLKEFYNSSYQFERFASSYPKSEKVEEASFLSAKSYYMLSPEYTKDQKDTKNAIEKLQEFINTFPDSEYLTEANTLIKELEYKLELKAFSIAKQYKDIAPSYTRDFQSAVTSFDNFVYEFPGSTLREDALFYRLEALFQQAINSVESKKLDRLNVAKQNCGTFKKTYPDSKFNEEVDKMTNELDEALKDYSV